MESVPVVVGSEPVVVGSEPVVVVSGPVYDKRVTAVGLSGGCEVVAWDEGVTAGAGVKKVPMPWFEEAWIPTGPDWKALWRMADSQSGFFTNADARACGIRRSLLSYYALRGAFLRPRRGVYRLRDLPPAPLDRIRAEWVARGRDRCVISHESALFVTGLLPREPPVVHLTLPRSRRGKIPRRELAICREVCHHVPRIELERREITIVQGIRVTTATRSLLDVARSRSSTEDLHWAVQRAIERGMVDGIDLVEEARGWDGGTARRASAAVTAVMDLSRGRQRRRMAGPPPHA